MKNNQVSVFLWGTEICRLEWRGGYKKGFGKLGIINQRFVGIIFLDLNKRLELIGI